MNALSDQLDFWQRVLAPVSIPYDTALIPPLEIQPEKATPSPGTIYPESIHALASIAGVSGDLTQPSTLKPHLAKVSPHGAVHVTAANAAALRTNEGALDGSGNAIIDFNGEVSSTIYFRLDGAVTNMSMAIATRRTQAGKLWVQGLNYLTLDQGDPPAVIHMQGIGVILSGNALDSYKLWWTV